MTVVNDRCVASAGLDHTIRVQCRDATRQRSLNNHSGSVTDLALRPADSGQSRPMIASSSEDQTVRFWQPTIGRLVRFVQLEIEPECLLWTSDGKRLVAACRDGSLIVVDPDTAAIVDQHHSDCGWIHCMQWLEESKRIVAGGQNGEAYNGDQGFHQSLRV